MKSVLLLSIGVAAGFAIAHQVSRTAEGRRIFDEIDGRARDFGNAVIDGYHSREAELRSTPTSGSGSAS